MPMSTATPRPTLVTLIAGLFALAAVYLWTLAAIRLLAPGSIPLTAGSPLMYGMELAGPYMALLFGAGWGLVGWGLARQHNWARWAAILVLTIGVAWLVPKISSAELGSVRFSWDGVQIAIQAAAAWYLAQAPAVIDGFTAKAKRSATDQEG